MKEREKDCKTGKFKEYFLKLYIKWRLLKVIFLNSLGSKILENYRKNLPYLLGFGAKRRAGNWI